ncbi:MAG TPA: glutathione transferase GstA [Candidatus Sulfotelmatobacter sp.]|nr:glutathione transferase GstA [Candidatus Sulfotelmatobacter sp.]
MKLYFAPGACSLSPHIVLQESGAKFDTEQVDLKAKTTKSGADYRAVNPKGAVPALQLDDGQVLTEGSAIVQYIADKSPGAKLAPAAGSIERYRLQEWLNYVASEVHKGFSPLFNPKTPDEYKAMVKDMLAARFDFLTGALKGKSYLLGEAFSVADAYLFTILNWTFPTKIDLGKWPVLKAYYDRIAARPAVQTAMKAEGLIK